ncbi:hypothetical protein C488_18685 [Natrinema pellirubrum DSM 15624]|uniref:Cardiolipin synthase N-terminal domain-containing protein n=1 Tax=Natrinema pellirubrum (strain DSM 15624 / CIP 106293 / JCM 10476 / NCIMB 786 / 157) TaxID=797303 RepID=L0JSI0_NATP1|nr:hypothetical protein [Natrinema pellirubrum]AGB33612.1 hypothetical protein Natpe_3853 [Natrinema pellirubrum DSM 15624]ELY70469.1 hypothetical protein C488_18685 [Natrinema pellirubrum DSM 15624]
MLQLALFPLQSGGEDLPVDSTTMLAAMVIGLIIGVAITVGVAYWVYKDASKRENNELAWAVGVGALLFFAFPIGVIAVIAYVLLRGDETTTEPMGGDATGGDW